MLLFMVLVFFVECLLLIYIYSTNFVSLKSMLLKKTHFQILFPVETGSKSVTKVTVLWIRKPEMSTLWELVTKYTIKMGLTI